MFKSTNQEILASLRDFIGDALAEQDITPSDILEAIQDELKELIDYHKIQGGKASKLLGMVQTPEDVVSFSDRFREIISKDQVEDDQDHITFGGYDFNLSSDYITDNVYRPQAAQEMPWQWIGGIGNDTISFNIDDKNMNKKKWSDDRWNK